MGNIITADLSRGRKVTTPTVFQWDSGMVLRFIRASLPESFRVDFSNSVRGKAKSMIGSAADGVEIPDEYFAPGSTIYAWIVVSPNAGSAVAEWQISIPIDPKARATGENPTPHQESVIDQAIAALNDGVERAEAAADEAEQAVANVQEAVDAALEAAKESGEFDGPPGPGVAPGGTTGQVLAKKSSADYDTEWVDQSGGSITDVQINGESIVTGGIASLFVATEEETRQIIIAYEEDDDGMVVHMTLIEEGDPCFVSEETAESIATAFSEGRNVVFSFPSLGSVYFVRLNEILAMTGTMEFYLGFAESKSFTDGSELPITMLLNGAGFVEDDHIRFNLNEVG